MSVWKRRMAWSTFISVARVLAALPWRWAIEMNADSMPKRMAMMTITTRISISVVADRRGPDDGRERSLGMRLPVCTGGVLYPPGTRQRLRETARRPCRRYQEEA